MAIVVKPQIGNGVFDSTTINVALPTGGANFVALGDRLISLFSFADPQTGTDPAAASYASFTAPGGFNADNSEFAFQKAAADSTDVSVSAAAGTIPWSCLDGFIWCDSFLAIAGLDAVTPYAAGPVNASVGSTTFTGTIVNPTAGLILLMFVLIENNSGAVLADPAGMTKIADATSPFSDIRAICYQETTTASGSLTRSGTITNGFMWGTTMLILNPAGSGGGLTAWAGEQDTQHAQARPLFAMHQGHVLPPLAQLKKFAPDVSFARALTPPTRVIAGEAVPALAMSTARALDVSFARVMTPPGRVTHSEALPRLAGALVRHAPDVSSARACAGPTRATNESTGLSALLGALIRHSPDVNFARCLPKPSAAANESTGLPRLAGALVRYAPDVPNSTQGARPTQVMHTDTLPALPSSVTRFAPDVDSARQGRPPARAQQDIPVPGVSSATVPAPRVTDWNYLRMMPPPMRVTHDPQPTRAPFFLVVPWAPDVSFAQALPGPMHAGHDWTLPALAKASVRVQDVHYARAMPAPSRVQHDAVIVPPSVLGLVCDVHFSRALPGSTRAAQDQTLPRPITLARMAPDVDFARALPAPTRVTHDWTLPGIQLARYVPDVSWQRSAAEPMRVMHEHTLGPIARLVSWVADWNYARGLPGPGVSSYPEVYGHRTLGLFDPGTTLYATVTLRLTESWDATPVQLTYLRGVSVYPRGRNKY